MRSIQARDYRDIARASDPRLSPDGDAVAFLRTVPRDDETYEATVYVAPTDGGASGNGAAGTAGDGEGGARQFTAATGRDAEPRYGPDGDRLAFTSDRGDDDRRQLWVLPVDGGEARRVTAGVGGVEDVAWSPDGDRIAFTRRTTAAERRRGLDTAAAPDYEREPSDPRVIDRTVYRAGASYFDGTRSHVYTVSLADGTVARHTGGDRDFLAPTFGAGDELYYAVCRDPDPDDSIRYEVDVFDPGSAGAGAETGEGGSAEGCEAAETVAETTCWEPTLAATTDGLLAYPRTPPDRATLRSTDAEVLDRATGETVVPTAGLDRTVAPESLTWDPDGDALYFLTPDRGEVVLRRTRPEDGAATPAVAGGGEVTGAAAGSDRVAFVRSEWEHPGDVFLRDVGDGPDPESDADGEGTSDSPTSRLTALNADYLAERRIAEPEPIRFTVGDREIQGWVLAPPGGDSGGPGDREPRPLVVEIHGGPHAMWTTSGTMWHEYQTLAARGYAVFWCNPRGSTGYGEAFRAAIDRDWGAATARDVLAGVDRVCERPDIDDGEQFVTGGSFGGFMTAWLVGHTDRFAAAVAQRGVYDLSSFYGSTDAFKLVEWDFDATPWTDPEFLWEQSPVAHVESVTTPTLLLHADADYRVPVNNAEMLHRLLRKRGVDTRLVRYPREGHELSRSGEPAHVVDRIERIVRWFDGYSAHSDAPRALDRGEEGLSGGSEDGDDDPTRGDAGG